MTDETTAPDAHDVERPPLRALRGVRYIGNSDRREISAADLGVIGIQAKGDLAWSADNDRFLPISALNAATVDHLAASPTEFLLVEDDED